MVKEGACSHVGQVYCILNHQLEDDLASFFPNALIPKPFEMDTRVRSLLNLCSFCLKNVCCCNYTLFGVICFLNFIVKFWRFL